MHRLFVKTPLDATSHNSRPVFWKGGESCETGSVFIFPPNSSLSAAAHLSELHIKVALPSLSRPESPGASCFIFRPFHVLPRRTEALPQLGALSIRRSRLICTKTLHTL